MHFLRHTVRHVLRGLPTGCSRGFLGFPSVPTDLAQDVRSCLRGDRWPGHTIEFSLN